MKYNKILFVILEEIEKKKIEIKAIKIKKLHLNQKELNTQLKLLFDYQKEYINTLYKKMILGICIHEWKNYHNFLFMLQKIIKKNKNMIKQNNNAIENSLKDWSKNKIRLKIWERLNLKSQQCILKFKTTRKQIIHDKHVQLQILNKERQYNVRNNL